MKLEAEKNILKFQIGDTKSTISINSQKIIERDD